MHSGDRFAVALVPVTIESTTLGAALRRRPREPRGRLLERLAARYERPHPGKRSHASSDLMPWKGYVSGRLGVEKVVAQIAAGGCVVVYDRAREG